MSKIKVIISEQQPQKHVFFKNSHCLIYLHFFFNRGRRKRTPDGDHMVLLDSYHNISFFFIWTICS